MFKCVICKSELIEYSGIATCTFCGAKEEADYICPNGHYQCEDCRLATQSEIIERVCLNTKSKNPVDIVNLIMKHASFNAYGAEHHELAAPAILSALKNLGYVNLTAARIKGAMKRGSNIPYGSCGSTGACGASISAGIAISMFTKSNYLKDRERSLTIKTVSKALMKLTDLGGPRCCKFSTYAGIESAWNVLINDLGLNLEPLNIVCDFQGELPDCKKEKCPYYKK